MQVADEPDISVEDEELPADAQPKPTRAKADPARAERAREADALLAEARSMLHRDPAKSLELTQKSLAKKRTAGGFSLLGLLACSKGNKALALKALRNLKGRPRDDVVDICSRAGLELK